MEMHNRSVLDEVRIDRMQYGDDQQPCLAVAFSLVGVAGEVPTSQVDRATITIAPTGDSSKLLITLKVYRVDETGTALSTTTTSIPGDTYTTLKDVIIKINSVAGFKAWALHCPHAKTMDSDNFIALAETDIRVDGQPLECLYRDADQDLYVYMRIGNPTARDSGRVRLLAIDGIQTGHTASTLKLYRDDYDEGAVELLSYVPAADTQASYLAHDMLNAAVYRGPLLLALYASNLSAADISARTMQAEY